MKRTKSIVGALLIFALGVSVGGFGAWRLITERVATVIQTDPSLREERIMDRLTRKLELTLEQQERIRIHLEEGRMKRQQNIGVMRREVVQSVLETAQAIRKELTPAQKRRFDRMMGRLMRLIREPSKDP